jgi:hypothetical protein
VSIGLAMEAAVNVIRAVERKVASLGLCDRVIPGSRPRARSPKIVAGLTAQRLFILINAIPGLPRAGIRGGVCGRQI